MWQADQHQIAQLLEHLTTGVQPVLAEYQFLPVHCYIILSTQNKIMQVKWCNILLHWWEMVVGENWLHASNLNKFHKNT